MTYLARVPEPRARVPVAAAYDLRSEPATNSQPTVDEEPVIMTMRHSGSLILTGKLRRWALAPKPLTNLAGYVILARRSRKDFGVVIAARTLGEARRKLNRSLNKRLYPYLSRRVGDDVLFLNWSYEEDPPMMDLPLDAVDEPNRCPIRLYHRTATQAGELAGKRVLEVGCGHGGGASHLTRALAPASYLGLDLNPAGIEFCRQRHQNQRRTI